ncbi:hypothetical protein H0178_00895 [Cytobacillus firmus]|nr:hypothetical protein [Cytobacillus firmus]
MNNNKNKKIAQITPYTDYRGGYRISKFKHVARAQGFQGNEFGIPCYFKNAKEGFEYFLQWISETIKHVVWRKYCRFGSDRS